MKSDAFGTVFTTAKVSGATRVRGTVAGVATVATVGAGVAVVVVVNVTPSQATALFCFFKKK